MEDSSLTFHSCLELCSPPLRICEVYSFELRHDHIYLWVYSNRNPRSIHGGAGSGSYVGAQGVPGEICSRLLRAVSRHSSALVRLGLPDNQTQAGTKREGRWGQWGLQAGPASWRRRPVWRPGRRGCICRRREEEIMESNRAPENVSSCCCRNPLNTLNP